MRTHATVAFGSSRIYFFIQLINQVRDTDNAGNREASVTVYCTDNRFCIIFSIVQWNYDTAEPGQKYDLQYISRILLLYNNTDTIFENSWISIIYYTNIPRKQFTPSSSAHRANNIQNLFLCLILYQHNYTILYNNKNIENIVNNIKSSHNIRQKSIIFSIQF